MKPSRSVEPLGTVANICIFLQPQRPTLDEKPGLGDIISRNLGLALIAQRFPSARICLVTSRRLIRKYGEFFLNHAYIHELIPCPEAGEYSPLRWLAFVLRMRARRFDLCVIDAGSRSAIQAYLCGIPERIGAATSALEARLLTRRISARPDNSPQRQLGPDLLDYAAGFAKTLRVSSFDPKTLVPRFPFRQETLPELEATRPRFAVHAGGAPHWNRRWPPESYAYLCTLLVRKYGATLYLLGGTDDREEVQRLRLHIVQHGVSADKVHDCTNTTLNQMANYVNAADLFIGNDSSLMHMAAALGKPIVVICGPGNPFLWERAYPGLTVVSRRWECQLITHFSVRRHYERTISCADRKCPYAYNPRAPVYPACLTSISVDEVARAVEHAIIRL